MKLIKQHSPQSSLALVFFFLSASVLFNYQYTQRKAISEQPVGTLVITEKTRSPKLVWLMSWPNSGTSYTIRQVENLSNLSMATNYGHEKERNQELVYKDLPEGPRCRGPEDRWPRPIPKDYVLVKTHCAGYGTNDGAGALKQESKDFANGCATTRPEYKGQSYMYDTKLVHKAVHVVRNPFHNLVSRFNCEHKLKGISFTEKYPKGAIGFKRYCHDLDADFPKQYRAVKPESVRRQVYRTPCHDDVVSYVQWHNHAFETARELNLPTLVVHYEDFEDDMNMTFANLLDFLHLPAVGKPKRFTPRHDYEDYFSSDDRMNIKALLKMLASNQTWNVLARYFNE